MDLTTSNHSGLSTHELFHKIRKDDDAMIRITVSQAPRKGEDAVKESSLLGEAIERNSHIQRLDIKLPRVIDFDRWQLFAKGIAGNSSIKTISFSWDVRGTIGLIHVLQYFGAFLEQNSRLEAFQVMAGQLVVNDEEMRTLLAPLSRRNHPLNSFRILCGGFVNQLMQVFVLVFSVNPSVTPKSIDITSSVEGAGHEREVLECLSKLSHTPYCTLESFGAPVNHVDRDAIKILAKLLSGNKTLTTIMLRTTENRGISHAEWQDLDNVLWDKSSLKATLNSNHTLCFLNLGRGTRIPADIGRTLELNLNGNKNLVARKKVFITHFSGNGVGKGALDELNAAFLVHIIAFFDRMLEETGVMAFLIYSSRNFRFTFLYQLLKRNPMLLNSFQ